MSLATMARMAAAPGVTVVPAPSATPSAVDEYTSPGAPGAPPPPPPPATPVVPPGAPPAPQGAVRTALAELAAYIPAEVLALYMAMLGICISTGTERQYGLKWLLFGAGVALVVFYIADGYFYGRREAQRAGTAAPSKQTAIVLGVLGMYAFAIYAASLPDNPFEQLSEAAGINLNKACGVAAVISAFLIPRVARWFGVSAPT